MHLLIVDDDTGICELVKDCVEDSFNKFSIVYNAEDAITTIGEHPIDLMILDLGLPDLSGKEMLQHLIADKVSLPPFIVSTGQGDERIAVEMMRLGAKDYVVKDVNFLIILPEVVKRVLKEMANEKKLLETEAQLRHQEEKLTLIVSAMEDVVCSFSWPDFELLYINQSAEKLFGFGFKELQEARSFWKMIVHIDDLQFLDIMLEQIMREHRTEVEMRIVKRDQTIRWINARGVAVIKDNGIIHRMDYLIRDVTDRKLAEEALLKSEEKYRLIAENTGDVIQIIDLNLCITYISPAVKKILGYEPDELVNTPITNIISKDSVKDILSLYVEELEKDKRSQSDVGQSIIITTENLHKEGRMVWIESTVSFIRDHAGKPISILTIDRDITEKRRMMEDLVTAKEKAEAMNRVKSNFFANMSHEVRTPLNGILGFSEILESMLPGNSEEFSIAQKINISGRRLLETLNLVLNISKLESDQLEIKLARLNIVALLKEIVDLFSVNAMRKGVYLHYEPGAEEIFCMLDSQLFGYIFNNLLSNALKFTRVGGVTVLIERKNDMVEIRVKDTGVGIPHEKIDVIWEEFRQVSEGLSRGFEGTGLGLTIAKRCTDLLKGSITVTSTVDVGTTFTITFPSGSEFSELEN